MPTVNRPSPLPGPAAATKTAAAAKERKLQRACKDFEALLIKQLLTTMRKSVPKDGLFTQGFAEETYQDMYDDQLARKIAHGRGMGIAEAMYKQLSHDIHLTIEDIRHAQDRQTDPAA